MANSYIHKSICCRNFVFEQTREGATSECVIGGKIGSKNASSATTAVGFFKTNSVS